MSIAPIDLLVVRDLLQLPGNRRLLDIPELAIRAGEFLLLTGAAGVGKSTLLKIVAGLQAPDRARVRYLGVDLSWRRARARYASSVIYLHQQPYVFDASVADNVAYGLRRAGVTRRRIAHLVRTALGAFDLLRLHDVAARSLDAGERRCVALARAWILLPRILLLDEPTAEMSATLREQTWFMLRRLRCEGVSVAVASRETRLRFLADRHLELRDAQLLAQPLPPPRRSGPACSGGCCGLRRTGTPAEPRPSRMNDTRGLHRHSGPAMFDIWPHGRA